VLYADPDKGPQLVAQGTFRGIDLVASNVTPIAEGKAFGWKELGDDETLAAMNAAIDGNDTAVAELRKVAAELQKANDAYQALKEENEALAATVAAQEKILNQKPEPQPADPTGITVLPTVEVKVPADAPTLQESSFVVEKQEVDLKSKEDKPAKK
jgi:hypothetical protein